MLNPFTPAFGKIPAYFAGREHLIEEVLSSLDNGPGDPAQTLILVGARGTGKTATLGYISKKAMSQGWINASITASVGMLEDLLQQAARNASHLIDTSNKSHISDISVNIAGLGASVAFNNPNVPAANFRTRITNFLDALDEHDTGLLITVDEVNPKLDEMIQLVTVYQHLVVEERKVALLMAGLPHKISQLVGGDSVSFLRRAARKEMGSIADYEIKRAFEKSAQIGNKSFAEDALELAIEKTDGFPFMLQLIGFRSWAEAKTRAVIDKEDVEVGVELAKLDMKQRVLKPTCDELSEKDLLFLQAMLEDEVNSSPAGIGGRLDATSSWVSSYKRRLLDCGVIEKAGRKNFKFALPLLREYLPEYIEDACL